MVQSKHENEEPEITFQEHAKIVVDAVKTWFYTTGIRMMLLREKGIA
ncbi:MAG: hypothetical protein L3J18_08505 [Candidatus Brocadia sp.]|jgi:hypothetical protein|uniref:Uncharacterized protein n=1 Tax=Candidatus Brocadia fulgida TaxID=380242 RepID=A0A0M2UU15_9BACT|nr:MAG: hypothetical protein BROFUL_03341 [Candidatus Brocadia fulgida]MCC6325502.1 hypothetical protein [Candidatus Brocadia sp.]UJS22335.1 MAG: hypothetical protein L3J18_08505 [Candidatus Brocadia sp.]